MFSFPKSAVILGMFWSGFRSWGVRATTLTVFLVLARLMTPAEIGVIVFILGWLALIGMLGDLGLAEYVVYNDTAPEIDATIWWYQILSTLVISGILAVILYTNTWLIDSNQPDAQMAALWLIITLPLIVAIKIPEAIMRRRMDFKFLAIRSLISIILGAFVAILLAYKGFGIWSLVFKQIVEALSDLVLFFYYSKWLPKSKPSFDAFQLTLKGGWGIVGSRILDVATQKADAVIIGIFIGMQELGLYSIALRIYQVLNEGIVQPITSVMATAFGRVKQDVKKFKVFFLNAVQLAALITIPIFAFSYSLGGQWIPIVFGTQWQESSLIFQIMCISGILVGYSGLNGFSLLSHQRNKEFMLLMSYSSFISLILLIVLAPLGINAVAWKFPLKSMLIFPVSLWLAKRMIGFQLNDYYKHLLQGFILGVMVLVISYIVISVLDSISVEKMNHPYIGVIAETLLALLLASIFSYAMYGRLFKKIGKELNIKM